MKRTGFGILVGILVMATGLLAQPGFTIEDVMSAPFPTELVASTDGASLAWVFDERGARNIWIAEGAALQPRRLTNWTEDDGQAISNLTFLAGDSLILFVHGGAPNGSGEIPNPALHPDGAKRTIMLISVQTGTLTTLAEGGSPAVYPDGENVAFVRQGQVWTVAIGGSAESVQLFQIRGQASGLVWSPDNANPRLAFASNRGTHSLMGVYDLSADEISYPDPSVDTDSNPVWSEDGRYLLYMRVQRERERLPFQSRREGLPWSIRRHDVETGLSGWLWQASEGQGSVFRSISSSNQLLSGAGYRVVFPWEADGWTHLYSVPVRGGDPVRLTPGDFEVQFVALDHDHSHVLYSSNQNDSDRQHIWRVPIEGGQTEQVTSGDGIEWHPVGLSNGRVAWLGSGATTPAHPAVLDGGGMRALAPDEIPARLPSNKLVEPEQVVFAAADGMKIHGQLFLPAGESGTRHPAMLFFHGGSRRQMLLGFHHRGYYHNAYAFNQYLASQGYVVLSVNYRSGIGYGMAFREALNYGPGGASEFNDVLGAGLFLQGREDVDPDRIGLWGGSYGGYLTALGLSRASDLFAAGVDLHGVHDWNVVIKNFAAGYDAAENAQVAELAYRSSPMSSMDTWRSPVLLIHGDDDRNVPFSETVDVVESLRRQGVRFEQLIFPDEVHGFLLHRNWVSAFEASADFLDCFLLQ